MLIGIRRLLWWAALNVLGPVRCRYFGTFGITFVGSQGASITHLVPLLTSQLHYGMFDPAGGLEISSASGIVSPILSYRTGRCWPRPAVRETAFAQMVDRRRDHP